MKVNYGFLGRLFKKSTANNPQNGESRSFTLSSFPSWFLDWLGSDNSGTGNMSAENSLKFSAVYACMSVISMDLGSLPFQIFRRKPGGGREIAYDHPAYKLVHNSPNQHSTSIVYRETKQNHILLTGNGYSRIVMDENRNPLYLELLMPNDVEPVVFEGSIYYKVKGFEKALSSDEVLHIPGLGFNGITGQSVIKYASEAIGLGLSAQKMGKQVMKNSAKLSGVFETEGYIDEPGKKRLQDSWDEKYAGTQNVGKAPILPKGLKYKPISMSQEDAQYVETRKFQITDICRWFRVPPHMIADLEKATFSNIEHQSIEYVTRTLRSWIVRWEQEYNKKLLGINSEYYAEMNIEGMLRGDTAARATLYREMFNIGVFSQNMILEKENMNPIANGDRHYVNGALVPVDKMDEIINARTKISGNGQK